MKKQYVADLLSTLSRLHESVKEKSAFLALKLSELRPGDEISQQFYQEAREQLIREENLLLGHARKILDLVQRKRIRINRGMQLFLESICFTMPQ